MVIKDTSCANFFSILLGLNLFYYVRMKLIEVFKEFRSQTGNLAVLKSECDRKSQVLIFWEFVSLTASKYNSDQQ